MDLNLINKGEIIGRDVVEKEGYIIATDDKDNRTIFNIEGMGTLFLNLEHVKYIEFKESID